MKKGNGKTAGGQVRWRRPPKRGAGTRVTASVGCRIWASSLPYLGVGLGAQVELGARVGLGVRVVLAARARLFVRVAADFWVLPAERCGLAPRCCVVDFLCSAGSLRSNGFRSGCSGESCSCFPAGYDSYCLADSHFCFPGGSHLD